MHEVVETDKEDAINEMNGTKDVRKMKEMGIEIMQKAKKNEKGRNEQEVRRKRKQKKSPLF